MQIINVNECRLITISGGTFCGGWDLASVSQITQESSTDVLPEAESGDGPMVLKN